jgi:CDP-2,3-bis-(O-geranylgeranyl)-sn-glycerol synthase
MITLYSILIYPILFILPAWITNAVPVIFGGGAPLDFGRKIGGKRVFGDHKTIRGTLAGLLGGFVTSLLLAIYYPFALGAALTIGAVFGDLLGSFIKRRFGLKEGASVLGMDQYLFFITAVIFALPFISIFPSAEGLIVLVVLTGLLHKLSNVVAHRLKLKKVPW